MPSDGHCLFSALVCQFYHSDPGEAEHSNKVMELRRQVVEYIKNNMEDFRETLNDTASTLDHLNGYDVESKIEDFLTRLSESNEWGGAETISAAANIMRRRIDIYNENGEIITFNRSDTCRGVLRIAYRLGIDKRGRKGRALNRVHYDSVIQRVRPATESENSKGITNSSGNFAPPNSQIHNFQNIAGNNVSQIPNDLGIPSEEMPAEHNEKDKFVFMSWNVRGCTDQAKRNDMDNMFKEHNYEIIALQETRIAECTLETSNYYWFNVNTNSTKNRIGGGTAILVKKSIMMENSFKKISDNACAIRVNIFGFNLIFISCYIRNDNNVGNQEFSLISRYLLSLPDQYKKNVIMAGDMNAHIGTHDYSESDKSIIGKNLFHQSITVSPDYVDQREEFIPIRSHFDDGNEFYENSTYQSVLRQYTTKRSQNG
ncbi:uncharacterized protein LOC134210380 [Armigeres subalbatus]|uniref:uncharacterized protein LOC134210380 n=1 Tax=Armigeres subalbatus TaxID=124917 RepID=UPI002ED32AEE